MSFHISASRLLRRKIPQTGHLMTSKRFWMQTIPNHVSLFQFKIIRVLALLRVKSAKSGISIKSMSKHAFVYKHFKRAKVFVDE